MRVLFTSLRNTSHFLPLVPFIDACLRRGHEVGVCAPSDIAERVAKTGARFFPVGHPGDAALQPIWARLPKVPPEEAGQIVIAEIFAGACAAAALPELHRAVDEFRPGVLIRESQEYAAVIAAEKAGLPHARVAISLNGAELGLMYPLASAAMDRHRERLGLSTDPSGRRLVAAPALTLLPGSLEPADAPGAASVRRFHALEAPASPLPAWWGADSRPLLYVTLGTVAGGMAPALEAYRLTLQAVGTLPFRVLFTIGAELSPEALGEVPANVRVERFVPQNDVFPHAAATLFHGGSGTMLGTLAAGIPAVVLPLFADQPYNAERIAHAGAGIAVDRASRSVEAIRQAISRVLEEDSFRTAARRIAAEIAALPSIDEAALEIERIGRGEVPA